MTPALFTRTCSVSYFARKRFAKSRMLASEDRRNSDAQLVIGWLTVQAILDRDYAVVQTAVLLFVVGLTLVNLLVDLGYAYLNPRVRARLGS